MLVIIEVAAKMEEKLWKNKGGREVAVCFVGGRHGGG